MAFQPVPNTAQVEIRFLLDNQEVQNDLYFTSPVGWAQSIQAELAGNVFSWWQAEYQPFQVNVCALKEIYVTPLITQTAETYSFVPTVTQYGAVVDEPEPNNVSFVVKLNTANRGRGSSGRNYTIGVYDSAVSQNTFTDDYVNGIVGGYNNLKNYIDVDTPFTWVHVRRIINKVVLPEGLTYPVQSATFTDKTVDSQRRRLPGRGQ